MTTQTTKLRAHPELRERVLSWRKAIGISQVAAAVRIGVPLRTFLRWEYGEAHPKGLYADQLNRIMHETTTK